MRHKALLLCILNGCSSSACVDEPNTPKACEVHSDCSDMQFCSEKACVLDAVLPSVTITSPAQNAVLTDGSFELKGTADDGDGSGVARVVYTFDGVTYLPANVAGTSFSAVVALPELDWASMRLSVRVVDNAGLSRSVDVPLTVDRIAPRISLALPEEPRINASSLGSTLSWSATVTDAAGLLQAEWSNDGGATWSPCETEGLCSYTLEVTPIDGMVVSFQVRAKDAAGHESTTSAPEVTIDSKAPTLQLTSPVDNALVTSAGDIVLVGSVSDEQLSDLVVTLDGTPIQMAVASGAFSAALPISDSDYARHEVVASAKDASGNETVVARSFAIDRQPPTLAITSPANEALFTTQTASPVSVSGTVHDAMLQSLSLQIDNSEPQALPCENGTFAVPLALTDEDLTPHTMRIIARDIAGHETVRSVAFKVDRRGPEITISTPTESQVLGRASSYRAAGGVADRGAVQATYRLGNEAGQPLSLMGGQFEVSLPFSDSEDYARHDLQIAARDAAGNETIRTRTFFIDRKAPQLTLTSPDVDVVCDPLCRPSAAVANTLRTALLFDGKATDGGSVTMTAKAGSSAVTVSRTGDSWSANWQTPAAAGALFDFVVTATDQSNNSTSVTRRVYVDRQAPTAKVLVANQRLVDPSSNLLQFSEIMNATTVHASTTLTPATSGFALTSADNRTFRAHSPAALHPYRVYALSLASGAEDVAGNPVEAPATGSFLTSTATPPSGPVHTHSFKSPKVAIDADGNPTIAAWDQTAGAIALITWDGSAWQTVHPPPANQGEVFELDIASSIPANGLALDTKTILLASVDNTAKLLIYERAAGWRPSSGLLPAGMQLGGEPGLHKGANTLEAFFYNFGDRTTYARSLGPNGLTWSDPRTLSVLPDVDTPAAVRGAAIQRRPQYGSTERAFYSFGANDVAEISTATMGFPIARAVSAAPPFAGSRNPTDSAWFAWVQGWAAEEQPGDFVHGYAVRVACSPSASPGTWRVGRPASMGAYESDPFPDGHQSNASHSVDRIELAVSSDRVALASSSHALSSVAFIAYPFAGCSASPTSYQFWEPAIGNAKEPAVAIGPNGRTWKVYLSSDSGTLMLAP